MKKRLGNRVFGKVIAMVAYNLKFELYHEAKYRYVKSDGAVGPPTYMNSYQCLMKITLLPQEIKAS